MPANDENDKFLICLFIIQRKNKSLYVRKKAYIHICQLCSCFSIYNDTDHLPTSSANTAKKSMDIKHSL